jgi:hypothetical protein
MHLESFIGPFLQVSSNQETFLRCHYQPKKLMSESGHSSIRGYFFFTIETPFEDSPLDFIARFEVDGKVTDIVTKRLDVTE